METHRIKYPNQRLAGMWFIWIGIIIILAIVFANGFFIQPALFAGGFAFGFLTIYILPFIKNKLSYGKPTKSQKIASDASMGLMAVLITVSVQWIGHSDLRTLWLVIFLCVGIHFIPFSIVHGKSLLFLGFITILCSFLGLILKSVPFSYFAYTDALVKICFGYYLFAKPPQRIAGKRVR